MKVIKIICVLICFAFIKAYSQQINIVAETYMSNIVYVGVNNPINIIVENCSCQQLYVTTNFGVLSKKDSLCGYILKVPSSISAGVDLSIYKITNRDTIFLGIKNFRIKRVPYPVSKIVGQHGGKMNCTLWKCANGVYAIEEGFDYNCPFIVIEFEYTIYRNDKLIFTRALNSNLFDTSVLKFNRNHIRKNDRIYIQKIKAMGCDNAVFELDSMEFKIIDDCAYISEEEIERLNHLE
jgi:hypothetical protein